MSLTEYTFTEGIASSGRAPLSIDGEVPAHEESRVTGPLLFNPDGLTCAAHPGSEVASDQISPFRFVGALHTVTIDLTGNFITRSACEVRMAVSSQ